MTALKVIGIILLIFILIGFLRVGALMQFGDELRVQLSVGPFRFTLLPAKEKKETPKKKAKEKKPKSEGEEAKQKKKPSLPKPTKEELRDLITTALSALKESCAVELYSDSKYVIDALEKGWARSWRARGWVKSDKKPALNPDLWAQLLELCEKHEMHYHWVKGHADNEYNNRCDALAVEQRDRYAK